MNVTIDRYLFVSAVLGQSGSEALKKAAELHPSLDAAIFPRCVISWLATCPDNYDGNIPGIDGASMSIKKTEEGWTGSVGIAGQKYSFANVSQHHVAACIITALGMTEEGVSDARSVDVAKLGRTVDLLIKSHASNAKKKPLEETAEEKPEEDSEKTTRKIKALKLIRAAVSSLRKKGAIETKGGAAKPIPPTPPEAPVKTMPKSTKPNAVVSAPAPVAAAAHKPSTAMKLSEKNASRSCTGCGIKFVKNNTFVGCMCIKELAKSIKATKTSDGYLLDMKDLDTEEIAEIMERLKW